jgi:hypothetical protein
MAINTAAVLKRGNSASHHMNGSLDPVVWGGQAICWWSGRSFADAFKGLMNTLLDKLWNSRSFPLAVAEMDSPINTASIRNLLIKGLQPTFEVYVSTRTYVRSTVSERCKYFRRVRYLVQSANWRLWITYTWPCYLYGLGTRTASARAVRSCLHRMANMRKKSG